MLSTLFSINDSRIYHFPVVSQSAFLIARFLVLRRGAFYTNFSITTPEFFGFL